MSFDYSFKFIFVGDTAVGKTSILSQFLNHHFDTNHEITIGVEFGSKTIMVNRQNIKLQIWDTAGQEEFRSITRSYYRSSAAALVVYDVTRKQTFRSVKRWVEEVRSEGNGEIVLVLIANKTDMIGQRVVSKEEGTKMARDYGMIYVQTSAKSRQNIDDAFLKPAASIMQKIQNGLIDVKKGENGVRIGTVNKMQNESMPCQC